MSSDDALFLLSLCMCAGGAAWAWGPIALIVAGALCVLVSAIAAEYDKK